MKVKTLRIALIAAIALFSCKKADTEEFAQANSASVEKIKNWYAKIPATTNNLIATKDINGLPKGSPDWTRVSYDQLEKTYTIPVTISSKGTSDKVNAFEYLIVKEDGKGNITSGNYSMVVIDKTKADAIAEGKINLKLLSIKQAPSNFNGAVLQYNMNNEFIDAGHYENGQLKSKTDQSTGKPPVVVSNNMPLPDCGGQEACIDWYWQHFENGVLMWEVYLYTTCNCVGNGGGGGGQVNDEQLNALFDAYIRGSHTVSNSVSEQTTFETTTERTRKYEWQFHQIDNGFGPAYKFFSVEIAQQTKNPNGTWKFISIAHSHTYQQGDAIGWTANHNINGSVRCAVGTGVLNSWGGVEFDYGIHIGYSIALFNKVSDENFTNGRIWSSTQGTTVPE